MPQLYTAVLQAAVETHLNGGALEEVLTEPAFVL